VTSGRLERRWAATLAGGVVVLAAVAGLLEALRRGVHLVDRRVEGVWTAGQRLAGVTQAAHLLGDTRRRTGELRAALDGDTGLRDARTRGTRTGER
jgi:DICT domain-containing protein